jgi:hypothetical protein
VSHCDNRTSIVCQKKKGDALNNAGQREFNVDDERVELATTFILPVHDATRNCSTTRMSRHSGICCLYHGGNSSRRESAILHDYTFDARLGLTPNANE